mgnify:CR=1 FL=1
MHLLLLVDAMAERYSTLPTHILRDATTLDMVVFDVAMTFKSHQRQKAESKEDGKPAIPPVSQKELEEIMRKHKEKYG